MRNAEWIEDQLRRGFSGEAWHGPSLSEVLADVTADEAAARPLPDAHTIWEIVLHVPVWHGVAERRLRGEPVGRVPDAEDWPSVGAVGESAWRESREALARGHERLRRLVAGLDDSRLEETAPGAEYSLRFLLDGVAQHDAYHAGQIALLKKAQRAGRRAPEESS